MTTTEVEHKVKSTWEEDPNVKIESRHDQTKISNTEATRRVKKVHHKESTNKWQEKVGGTCEGEMDDEHSVSAIPEHVTQTIRCQLCISGTQSRYSHSRRDR